MSERSKGDVSSQSSSRLNNNPMRVVTNPLLSASVTGMIDDFPNKPLLLPAAPPVVHAPPPQPTPVLMAGILNREPKTLVTVGQPSNLEDIENLDEINLNASSDDTNVAAASGIYANAADANANPLLEPPAVGPNDSLLSQAASSFTALPSVASNVFSTFSKRIYSGSTSRERTPHSEAEDNPNQPQLDIQPTYIQQAAYIQPEVVPPPFYAAPPPQTGAEAAPLEPPKFYAPTELAALPSVNPNAPPTTGAQNTYRFAAKKKLYAPIPGFTEQGQPQQPQQAAQLPFQTPPYPTQPAPQPFVSDPVPAKSPAEERKTGGGLFSLTNLVPTGVLQNISGLVQSASETLAPSYTAPDKTSDNYFDISTAAPQAAQSNFPAPSQLFTPVQATAPPIGSFFVPGTGVTAAPQSIETVGDAKPSSTAPPPIAGIFGSQTSGASVTSSSAAVSGYVPPQGPPAAQLPPPAAGQASYRLQKGTRLYRSPLTAQETAAPAYANQSAFAPTPIAPIAATPSGIFNPFGQPESASAALNTTAAPPRTSTPVQPIPAPTPPSQLLQANQGISLISGPQTTSQTSSYNIFAPPTKAAGANQGVPSYAPPPSVLSAPNIPLFAPSVPLFAAPTAQEVPLFAAPPSITSESNNSLFAPQDTPVTSGVGQKIESVQEVALFAAPPTSCAPPKSASPSLQPVADHKPEVQLFVPPPTVSSPQSGSESRQEDPLFAPTPATTTTSLFTPISADQRTESKQEVPLFAPTPAATSASLFTPISADPRTESRQEVPLFAPPPTAPANSLFTPTSAFPNTESSQSTSFVAAPPKASSSFLFAAGSDKAPNQGIPLFTPASSISTTPSVPLFAPYHTTPTSSAVLSTEGNQGVPLFTSTFTPSAAPNVSPFSSYPPTSSDAGLTTVSHLLQATQEAAPPAPSVPSFDLSHTATSIAEPLQAFSSTTEAELSTVAPPIEFGKNSEKKILEPIVTGAASTSNFFEQDLSEESSTRETTDLQHPAQAVSAALTTQTTPTFFNPFAQTITTPLAQQVSKVEQKPSQPPIGFVLPTTLASKASSSIETHTIEPVVSLAPPTISANPAKPPSAGGSSQANPFRKGTSAPSTAPQASPLQNFFTPAGSEATTSSDFNLFGAPSAVEQNSALPPPVANALFPPLPPQLDIAPRALEQEPKTEESAAVRSSAAIAPPPIGFDQLLTTPTQQPHENSYQNSSANTYSNFFSGSAEVTLNQTQEVPQLQLPAIDSSAFFDHFEPEDKSQSSNNNEDTNQSSSNEDQRIQNFFNNPPLQEQPAGPGDLKYDIVHSGLGVKNLEARSQTPISNLVEPPSSACSEFSELSGTPQRHPPHQAQQQTTPERQLIPFVGSLLQENYADLSQEILEQLKMANAANIEKGDAAPGHITYTPVVHHWFYKKSVDGKSIWMPFSHYDSALLETSLSSDDSTLVVAVEGGRYDVNIKERNKTPVYWEGKATDVRRCSWFYKGVDSKFVPYQEETALMLEARYKRASETGEWQQKIMLTGGEQVEFHGPTVMVHFHPQQNADTWGTSAQSSMRPRVVKRDLEGFSIAQGESQRVDHLLFMVHGIGSVCDLRMRSVEEVVDDFRNIAQQLVQSHYKNSTDMGLVGRVEVLPISWHGHLHSEELGIDSKLKSITLESIPRLRSFTNDTLLDVLFYTSPTFCQKIMNTVASSLNAVYSKYRARHPEFNGGVSLAGHSLGSVIIFDLLCHQEQLKESEEENMENPDQLPLKEGNNKQVQLPSTPNDMLPKQVSYTMGPAGTGQPVINYTQLIFHPKKFFALGSPIGMFVTIRGIDKLGLDFRFPTCPGFYNIFHPYDPVAYRIEALVNPDMNGIRPVLIPHHKGRKRMHLELKETMSRVGADIKQRLMDTMKTTLDSVNFLATVTKVKKEVEETFEKETPFQMYQKQIEDRDESSVASTSTPPRNRTDSDSTTGSDPDFIELDFPLGKLNDSKRVDYVLQEAPLEFINEYLFALSSHVCYWESEDTILFVMKEIYAGLGISTDSQVPQNSMTIERPGSRNSVSQSLLPL